MKTLSQTIRQFPALTIFLALLLPAILLGAARPGPNADRFRRGRGFSDRGVRGPMPGLRQMLNRLDLAADQESSARVILDTHRATLEDLGFDLLEAQRLLEKSVREPVTDTSAVKAASARRAGVEKKLELEKAAVWAAIFPLLTPGQKTDLRESLADFEYHRNRFERGRQKESGGRGDRPGCFPERRILGRMFRGIDLSDAQEARVREIMEERAATLKTLAREDREAHARLREAVIAPAVDAAAIGQACQAHAQAHEGLALQRAAIYAAVRELLTNAQKAQLDHRRERIRRLGSL